MTGDKLNEIKHKIIQPRIEKFVFDYEKNQIRHYITYCEECVEEINEILKYHKVPEDTFIELSNRYRIEIQDRIRKIM
tara:strand:- start:101 stop:334 length:234 start_codon:yes stop_codon:yes gene_type:complete